MSRFEILKSMKVGVTKPFRIIETADTLDGPRSRICDGTWASWKEAAEYLRPISAASFATHELSLILKEGSQVLYREEFYGSDVEASSRLTDLWNAHTPANGQSFQATIRRYGEPNFYEQIG